MSQTSVKEGLQSKEEPILARENPEDQKPRYTYFSNKHQIIELFQKFLGRWVLTSVICAAFIVVLKQYDQKPYLDDDTAHIYNALTSGLTICLSLNIDASLNELASVLKWAMLAARPFHPAVFELTLALDSSKFNAIKLLFRRSGVVWWLRLFCLFWIFITLAAQVGTALVGLTYSVISLSPDKHDFPEPVGNGFSASFTQIESFSFTIDRDTLIGSLSGDTLSLQRSTAFAYGLGAINSAVYFLDEVDGLSYHSSTFNSENSSYISGISNYPDWAANSLTQWNAIGRGVNNYAECDVMGNVEINNSSDTTTISFDGYNGTQDFTIPQNPLKYATYISDTSLSCGTRCTQVHVILSLNEVPTVFTCNSTVGWMYDWITDDWITDGDFSMPDTQAQILAGAIGWGDIEVNSSLDAQSTLGRFQASSFDNGSYWAPLSTLSPESMANWYVAHFTAAAIESIEDYGLTSNFTNIVVPGVAQQLDVKWSYSILVLAIIPGVQALLALACIAILYWRRVPAHNDSHFAMAALLGPVVSRINPYSLESGSNIANDIKVPQIYMPEHEPTRRVKIGTGPEWEAFGDKKPIFQDEKYF
ncbi:uncharacterized protein F4822DRAFT_415373 [Hypoxylon trugodes]|uniref:uncharacterized protein n=1 Tax=Hypoxylon trugodes TaxID=326681 RepID=UPI0021940020|nr:uncharacterized protein F4822DRAFT_415373 [Hypoxylon trugodes]KAI1384497.1 hypothetical protein F4822DRAFT_415373 [Hypoxylon trugodes]